MNSASFPRVSRTEDRSKPLINGYIWGIHGKVIDRKSPMKLSSAVIPSISIRMTDLFRSDGFRIEWSEELLTIRLFGIQGEHL